MTDESANALLKVLEEPPEDSVIILTSLDKTLLPETVVSRSQVVNFGASDVFDRDIDNEILEDTSKLMDDKGSVLEKFSIAHKYAKEKETAVDLLNSLEMVLRKNLLENNSSEEENINKLEKIQESRKYLQRNMSGKFVLENLILATDYEI